MVRTRYLLDVDGPLADFYTPCISLINEYTGWSKTVDDIKSWHIFRSLDVPKDVEKRIYDKMKSPGWCLSLDPIEDAVEAVQALREVGDVFFVTSPMQGQFWTYERTMWLIQNFDAKWSDVIHCSSKHVCAGDVLIDDRVSNLERWKASHPEGVALKFRGPYNRLDPWDGPVIESWKEELPDLLQLNDILKRRSLRTWTP